MKKNTCTRNGLLSTPMKSAITVAFLGTMLNVLPGLSVIAVALGGIFALILNHYIQVDFVNLWLWMTIFEAVTAFFVVFIIVFKNNR